VGVDRCKPDLKGDRCVLLELIHAKCRREMLVTSSVVARGCLRAVI
jgi:hypothetical protein